MRFSISDTAEYGDLTRGPKVIDAHVRAEMQQILDDIRLRQIREEWIAENRAGRKNFEALRAAGAATLSRRSGRAPGHDALHLRRQAAYPGHLRRLAAAGTRRLAGRSWLSTVLVRCRRCLCAVDGAYSVSKVARKASTRAVSPSTVTATGEHVRRAGGRDPRRSRGWRIRRRGGRSFDPRVGDGSVDHCPPTTGVGGHEGEGPPGARPGGRRSGRRPGRSARPAGTRAPRHGHLGIRGVSGAPTADACPSGGQPASWTW